MSEAVETKNTEGVATASLDESPSPNIECDNHVPQDHKCEEKDVHQEKGNCAEDENNEVCDEKEQDEQEDEQEEVNNKKLKELEKQEEAKLRARFPEMKNNVASSFLQKRLSKGTKYFDSGDYNMAKATVGSSKPVIGPGQKVVLPGPTGDAIPTPETVPHKKISNLQNKLVNTHLS